MLEILVSLRRSGGEGDIGEASTSEKKTGYIVAVKKSPAVWGSMEKKFFLLTYLDDSALEMEFGTKNVWINPLARYDSSNVNEPLLIERGCFRVDYNMFLGTDGLDPTVEVSSPTPPNGKSALKFSDLIYDAPGGNNKAVMFDCTGKKAALAEALCSQYSIEDYVVFSKSNKIWRHGLDLPNGKTVVSLDSVAPSIMGYPSPYNLVQAGLPSAQSVGAQYAIFGSTSDLPGVLTNCLANNIIPLRPLLGFTESQITSECSNNGIIYNDIEIEVEGQTVYHSEVTANMSSSSSIDSSSSSSIDSSSSSSSVDSSSSSSVKHSSSSSSDSSSSSSSIDSSSSSSVKHSSSSSSDSSSSSSVKYSSSSSSI